jgi:tRNA threonylcarbamoyl adenosine modification protein (Sua5/YciO/YrdC/YwlC family)
VSGPRAVRAAVDAALAGRLIVVPTDTVYGIGSRPDDHAATSRIFAAKGRPRDLELPVLAPSAEAAATIAEFDARAEALAERFWPGPLTIVLRRRDPSVAWELGGDRGTIGVRVPRHPLALAVLEETGPLAVTSANRSGEPPARTCQALVDIFADDVDVYLCQEEPLVGIASTIVDLAHGDLVVLRRGSLAEPELVETLARRSPDRGPR